MILVEKSGVAYRDCSESDNGYFCIRGKRIGRLGGGRFENYCE